MTFRALVLNQSEDKTVTHEIRDMEESELPDNGVLLNTEYTTMNYKDGMALMGKPGIVRSYPMIPGVDVVGTVASDGSGTFTEGQRVSVNGWDVGEAHWGGMAQKASMKPEWITPLPDGISNQQAAAIGTAGYTAMLSVMGLEELGQTPDKGPIIVTGAAGGVGSVAVAVAAKLGYEVIASTGRVDTAGDYLRDLGASEVIDRSELTEPGRPFAKPRWAGAIDAVGSHTLANVIAATQPNGVVTACGLVQGPDLPATVLPFILRGVTLKGINCVHESQQRRAQAWDRLATDLDMAKLDSMSTVVGLGDAPEVAARILDGQIRGRVVVDVNA